MTDIVVPPDVYADVAVNPAVSLDIVGGLPGPPGPPGLPGLIRVNHDTDPGVPRPAAPVVLWVGSVDPVNADQSVDLIARTS